MKKIIKAAKNRKTSQVKRCEYEMLVVIFFHINRVRNTKFESNFSHLNKIVFFLLVNGFDIFRSTLSIVTQSTLWTHIWLDTIRQTMIMNCFADKTRPIESALHEIANFRFFLCICNCKADKFQTTEKKKGKKSHKTQNDASKMKTTCDNFG